MLKPTIHLIKLKNVPIFEQLQIEEALLRLDLRNWCLVNTGSTPAIVLGISGKPEKLINQSNYSLAPVPVIRRFSGGGTVIVNEDTVFITFICNSEDLKVNPLPQAVFQWSEKIYRPVFEHLDFKLQENDYVIGDKKFGGNAQYLRQNRWLHHTSLLFDYEKSQMGLLSFPEKVPKYREQRNHSDFLCKLNNYFHSKESLKEKFEISLNKQFHVKEIETYEIADLISEPHRKSTVLISSW